MDNLPDEEAAFTKPPVESDERSIFPDDAIPVNPDAAPSVDIFHEEESIATVFEFPPIDTAPVDAPVFILVT